MPRSRAATLVARVERQKARVTRLEADLSEARRSSRRVLLEVSEVTETDAKGREVRVLSNTRLAAIWQTGPSRIGEWIDRARFERDGDD